MTESKPDFSQIVKLGLGEAIQRLIAVEFSYRTGTGRLPDKLLEERRMILEAMNHITIQIGFDCNGDGVPDDIQIFQQAAHTSCCRIQPFESSRALKTPDEAPKPKRSSRAAPARSADPPVVATDPEPVVATGKKKRFGLF